MQQRCRKVNINDRSQIPLEIIKKINNQIPGGLTLLPCLIFQMIKMTTLRGTKERVDVLTT